MRKNVVDRKTFVIFQNYHQKALNDAIMCQNGPIIAQNTGYLKFPVEISEIQKIYPIGI